MSHVPVGIGVARRTGDHSDGVLVSAGLRWFFTSGTPGLPQVGPAPSGITAQAEFAWTHIVEALSAAQMRVADIVKVTQYLTNSDDIPAYTAVRSGYLGRHLPASTLVVVAQPGRPDVLVEVEVIAARA
ncbi:MAG: RidA family protein [Brevundimonas sp.]